MVELQPSKLLVWVRFPQGAPFLRNIMKDFEITDGDPSTLAEVPTEILVTLAMNILEELEVRLQRKTGLTVVN